MKYKAYILGAVLALLLVFCANRYIDSVKTESYNSGFSAANAAWIDKGRQYVDMIDKKYAENSELTAALRERSLEKEELLGKLKDSVGNKVESYQKTADSKKVGLDDKFVDAYNESLRAE